MIAAIAEHVFRRSQRWKPGFTINEFDVRRVINASLTFIISNLSLSQRTNTLELKDSGSDVASDDTSWANRRARTMLPLPPLVAADRTEDAKW